MEGNRQEGFTLAELLVVMAVAAIMVVAIMMSYRIGFMREAALSSDARSLVTALNYARIRGLENKDFARVITSASINGQTDPANPDVMWYGTVEFLLQADKESDLKYLDNDFVTFTGLEDPHTDLNDMAHRIHPKTGTDFVPQPDGDKWKLSVIVEFPTSVETTTQPSSSTPEAAFMKCLSRASKLIIRKESALDPAERAEGRFDGLGYFVYKDAQVKIVMEPPFTGGTIPEDSILVAFDSMGFATRAEGYRLWVLRPDEPSANILDATKWPGMEAKVVNVTPLGRSFLWTRVSKVKEQQLSGKEGW